MSRWIVGLTGGIGSGKSAVSDRFSALGIEVVDADIASRAVVEPGAPALSAIAEHFGDEVIAQDGSLDRAELRKRVFEDTNERRWLEQLTHPLINQYIAEALARAESAYAILAHPLLVETAQMRICDRILVIDVPEELQLRRTMERDNNPESQVRSIMAAQASRAERLAAADDVIVNDRDLAYLDAEVSKLHADYLEIVRNLQSPADASIGGDNG